MKTDEKKLVIRGISVFEFLFLEMDNPWEQMLLVRWDILDFFFTFANGYLLKTVSKNLAQKALLMVFYK
jgi:hypothetical protein